MKVLKSKEVKRILRFLKERFGVEFSKDYAFFKSNKDKIYILSRDVVEVDLGSLRVDTLGFYFCNEEKDGFRLSFDGSMMVNAKKSVLELSDQDRVEWMAGEDIPVGESNGYYIIKNNEDFFGCGKVKEGKLLNYVPKSRRVY